MNEVRPDFQELFDEHKYEFLGYLDELLQIPSVNGNATFEAPFGIGPKRALEYMLALSKKLGFRTGSVSNCVGWAEYGPEDAEEYFGVLGHIDVVDVEDDWSYPPFKLTQVDNMMYGRGALDNKGPLMSTLFALYLLKLQGIKLNKRVRIMFGTDEESGSRDIPYYLKKQKPPYAGYTPDCKFPIVYGERGLVDLTVSQTVDDGSSDQIESISGQFDRSYIPDYAKFQLSDGTWKEFTGKKAPSNAPDMADNVLPKVADNLVGLAGQTGDFFMWLSAKLSSQYDGKNLGLNFADEASGSLQLSLYKIEKKDNKLSFNISMRYPISITEDKVINQLKSQLNDGMSVTVNRSFPSKLSEKNQDYIKRFSNIYEEDTGLDGTPVTTTGATYARAMPNIVAFGPSFPGQKGIAHKGDEWLQFSDWQMMMEVYYDCFINELC
ncbi:Sapep family Mn(2+)-dependent dipeptidase [Companilactobacillus hulinensis]|uniref:Sapep family Mn(2+)-dependent dipeptidase n=1 Tax=Companilactobacillus hulinensis TaxID=2486007 RepID=UPI000F77459E|nr:Sapep family Mn(2+)-dependent dipeptidase [Companilactobacillus hulinensis]